MAVNKLPSADSPHLRLGRRATEELRTIRKDTASARRETLPTSIYLDDCWLVNSGTRGGMTNWVLVENRQASGQRLILSSCESYRKRALASDGQGNVFEVVVYGIASVFCPPEYRGQGFARRMIEDLASKLPTYTKDGERCIGSILYSDVGQSYYAKLGWQPHQSNVHVELRAEATAPSALITSLLDKDMDLNKLCARDEARLRKMMAVHTEDAQTRMAIIPDYDHMRRHLYKASGACDQILMKSPQNKGAIVGTKGS
jgi:GNAT superfamily N-acetyltransferase